MNDVVSDVAMVTRAFFVKGVVGPKGENGVIGEDGRQVCVCVCVCFFVCVCMYDVQHLHASYRVPKEPKEQRVKRDVQDHQ